MTKIRLLGNRLHLWRLTPAEQSRGGIWFDMSRQDDRRQFRVLGVGPKAPPEIYPGCYVLIPWASNLVTLRDGSIIGDTSQVQAVWDRQPEAEI